MRPLRAICLNWERGNDVGADDPTAAWRTIASGEALLRLEEALVPFGERPQMGRNRHDSQDRAFCMVDPTAASGRAISSTT
jgi:hypothetical protein